MRSGPHALFASSPSNTSLTVWGVISKMSRWSKSTGFDGSHLNVNQMKTDTGDPLIILLSIYTWMEVFRSLFQGQ